MSLRRLADALLTTDAQQRIRLQQALLATLLMAFSICVLVYSAHVAGTPRAPVVVWALVSLGGLLATFVAIRSGWSRRFADPSLTLPQMLFAIVSGAVAYAMAGPLRGATFPVLMVILMFGMFQLRPRSVILVSAFSLVVFAITMSVMALRAPAVFTIRVELGHFVMLAAMLPAMSLLAARLTRLRERNRRQRHDLAGALARIQELATRDELTGLINRRHMAELLEQERQRAVRSGRGFCVALVDVDHFKTINDRHGHAAGDDVMRFVGHRAPSVLRSIDIVARWGGEEFVLLLPDAHLPAARAGVERVREALAAVPAALGSGVPIHITVSAGLTEHIAGETVAQALERADRALYEAKAQGRNRTLVG